MHPNATPTAPVEVDPDMYTLVSAVSGDLVPGTEISDPDSPIGWHDLPADAQEWATEQGYGDDEGELLYVLDPGDEVPDGYPSFGPFGPPIAEPTSRTVLTKTTRDGRTVTVDIDTNPANTGARVHVTAYVDGKRAASSTHLAHPTDLPAGAAAAVGQVAFTADEAARIEAALEEAAAALPRDLRAERRILVAALRAAEGAWSDARATAHNDGDLDRHFSRAEGPLQAAIDDATAALEDFDVAHPEVAETIRSEQAERSRIRTELGD